MAVATSVEDVVVVPLEGAAVVLGEAVVDDAAVVVGAAVVGAADVVAAPSAKIS